MGINDRHGINMEYPIKQAHVQSFRYRILFLLTLKILFCLLSRIFQYPVTVAAFRRYTQDKTRYRTQAETNGFSFILGNPTNQSTLNITSEVYIIFSSSSFFYIFYSRIKVLLLLKIFDGIVRKVN
jgi:hypothetical protein